MTVLTIDQLRRLEAACEMVANDDSKDLECRGFAADLAIQVAKRRLEAERIGGVMTHENTTLKGIPL